MTVNQALFLNKPEGMHPYYRGTTIVQSSSTGKLCMLLQLGHSVLLLYMCIHPQIATSASSGYPLGNVPIMDVTLTHFSVKARSTDLKATILLTAWFDTLVTKLKPLVSAHQKFQYLVELNNFDNAQHEDNCKRFFDVFAMKVCSQLLLALINKVDNAAANAAISQDVAAHSIIFQAYLNEPLHCLSDQINLL